MNNSKLQRDTILNGTNTLVVAKKEGLIYRVDPVPLIKQLTFPQLYKDKVYDFDLSKYIDTSYEAMSVIPAYDGIAAPLSAKYTTSYSSLSKELLIAVADGKRPSVVIRPTLSSMPIEVKGLIFSPDSYLTLRCSENIQGLHFHLREIIDDGFILISTESQNRGHTPVA